MKLRKKDLEWPGERSWFFTCTRKCCISWNLAKLKYVYTTIQNKRDLIRRCLCNRCFQPPLAFCHSYHMYTFKTYISNQNSCTHV